MHCEQIRDCVEPAISLHSHHVSLVQWPNLFASRHKGPRFKSPGGYLCETGILLLAWSRYIGDPDMIEHHCSLVCGGLRPKLSLGPRTDKVTSQSFSVPVSRSLQNLLPASQPTESAARGGPCVEPAISLHSHHVSLVQWTNLFASRYKGSRFKSPGGNLCETGILLLA